MINKTTNLGNRVGLLLSFLPYMVDIIKVKNIDVWYTNEKNEKVKIKNN